MLARLHTHMTFANVVSFMALFVALSGGAYALTLPKNSVGAKQLKTNAVTRSKIKQGAVTSAKVKDRSLLEKDFKAGQIPAGATGATGAQGPQGPPGQPGAAATKLWANVVNSFGTPTLVRGSGATGVAAAGTAQTRVTFNQDVRGCSYQATGWLNPQTGVEIYANPPIVVVERGPSTGVPATAVKVQTYTGTTGLLDSDYNFTVAVFC